MNDQERITALQGQLRVKAEEIRRLQTAIRQISMRSRSRERNAIIDRLMVTMAKIRDAETLTPALRGEVIAEIARVNAERGNIIPENSAQPEPPT